MALPSFGLIKYHIWIFQYYYLHISSLFRQTDKDYTIIKNIEIRGRFFWVAGGENAVLNG
jgi:hypothetical protein